MPNQGKWNNDNKLLEHTKQIFLPFFKHLAAPLTQVTDNFEFHLKFGSVFPSKCLCTAWERFATIIMPQALQNSDEAARCLALFLFLNKHDTSSDCIQFHFRKYI